MFCKVFFGLISLTLSLLFSLPASAQCARITDTDNCNDYLARNNYETTHCSGCISMDPPSVPTTEATFECQNTSKVIANYGEHGDYPIEVEELMPGETDTGTNTVFEFVEPICGYDMECDTECDKEVDNGHVTVSCVVNGGGWITYDAIGVAGTCQAPPLVGDE